MTHLLIFILLLCFSTFTYNCVALSVDSLRQNGTSLVNMGQEMATGVQKIISLFNKPSKRSSSSQANWNGGKEPLFQLTNSELGNTLMNIDLPAPPKSPLDLKKIDPSILKNILKSYNPQQNSISANSFQNQNKQSLNRSRLNTGAFYDSEPKKNVKSSKSNKLTNNKLSKSPTPHGNDLTKKTLAKLRNSNSQQTIY